MAIKGEIACISMNGVEPVFTTNSLKNSEIWNNKISIIKGKHLHIVAPSGNGKTSLIHFIYGLNSNYKGEIFYDSRDIKEFSSEEFASYRQKNISIVFQDLRLFPDQTVRENIELKRILHPYHSPEMIEQMAEYLGIKSKLDQLVKTCSYGEQQRTAIIRALMQPFDFILLDEPFSHLDNLNRTKAMKLIYEECAKRNASMILSNLNEEEFSKNEQIAFL
jgi:putative ABC transport system ATP-binding protein